MNSLFISQLLKMEIRGRSLREWDSMWKPLLGGIRVEHEGLKRQIGLVRADLNGSMIYIFRATEYATGGIEKGLQRIRGPEQSGNKGFGAQMLRNHIDELQFRVLLVGSQPEDVQTTKTLKKMMVKYHDPEWNRPAVRRMAALRAQVSV